MFQFSHQPEDRINDGKITRMLIEIKCGTNGSTAQYLEELRMLLDYTLTICVIFNTGTFRSAGITVGFSIGATHGFIFLCAHALVLMVTMMRLFFTSCKAGSANDGETKKNKADFFHESLIYN